LTAEVRAELARLFPRPKILERYRGDWTPHELAAMAAARPWRVIDRASELPRRARVRWHGGPDVGTLEEVARRGGETRFTYSAAYLVSPEAEPIAPNVPLRPEPYESEALHPFFANLLPEGALYLATAYRLGVRPGDPFGVLLGVGADVMGAVQVVPE
jgi:serine/threonine-protein kinase HipA